MENEIILKKEKKRLINKRYRETHKEKMSELVKKHYWKHIEEPEFKQRIKEKAKRYRDKKRIENNNNKQEYVLFTLET